MPLTPKGHLALIDDEFAAALQAPLSARQAMLVAMLIDHYPDRLFKAERSDIVRVLGAEDLPAYRTLLREQYPALAAAMAVCVGEARLVIKTVEVQLENYAQLSIEDFMVSLYNGHTVQRVMLERAGAPDRLAREVLAGAIEVCRRL